MSNKKIWIMYDKDGDVVTIFTLKPGWDYFEAFDIIEADDYEQKPGMYADLKVDLKTKKLLLEYKPYKK